MVPTLPAVGSEVGTMFQGFSQETVDFMWGIRFNNERSWFEAHKSDYQTYFLAPMK